ncbi:helix-turn-helix domain-containing protein [Hymenobacter elongatus]|uniref:XRE family transcriptional regulator n=1 Tax=Hymenobacter elongatus TaxID=877208 RepID=A0A4Z0PI19_9BACT|nr:helix-turn-helix transcriptional regulator [Hymenobacter elongatus]TGE14840.1 XRE family transcriptional regulator [Hymenobacter elongatus]
MSDIRELREQYGLTQEELANWLNIPRVSLTLAELGHRALPYAALQQMSRLIVAHLDMSTSPALQVVPPPLAPPVTKPLQRRQLECQVAVYRLGKQLSRLQTQARQYQARLAALPQLRVWPHPVRHAGLENDWLRLFEQDAIIGLPKCGLTAQILLSARIAALEREAELLGQALAAPATALL